jgi:hypothetical protein
LSHDGIPDVLGGEEVKALGVLELLGVLSASEASAAPPPARPRSSSS